MKIQEVIPNIEYDNGQYIFKNIFFKFYLKTPIDDQYLQIYSLSDGESLEDVSFQLYNDTVYFWTMIVINKLNDYIFDLPLPEDSIQLIAKDMAMVGGTLDMERYLEYYDQLSEENDAKRDIKVIKPGYLNKFLTQIIRESANNQ